jgi:hypothetical protein
MGLAVNVLLPCELRNLIPLFEQPTGKKDFLVLVPIQVPDFYVCILYLNLLFEMFHYSACHFSTCHSLWGDIIHSTSSDFFL